MAIKVFNIPIQAEEQTATSFVNAICDSQGFILGKELVEDVDIFQAKLNFVGTFAAKHLRQVAEQRIKQDLIQAKKEEVKQAIKVLEQELRQIQGEIHQTVTESGDTLKVLPIEVVNSKEDEKEI